MRCRCADDHRETEESGSKLNYVPQGPGWWLASDQHWYPPELHPDASTESRSSAWSMRFAFAGLGILPASFAYVMALPNPDCITNCPKVDPHHLYAAIGFIIFGVCASASILSIVLGLISVVSTKRTGRISTMGRTALIMGIIDAPLVVLCGLGMAFIYVLSTNPNAFQF
jgi:hypothetical protein